MLVAQLLHDLPPRVEGDQLRGLFHRHVLCLLRQLLWRLLLLLSRLSFCRQDDAGSAEDLAGLETGAGNQTHIPAWWCRGSGVCHACQSLINTELCGHAGSSITQTFRSLVKQLARWMKIL